MPTLARRDHDPVDNGDYDNREDWYFSGEASSIKYGILFGILALAALIIVGSWLHARQRMKKGFAPLRYHRWLVPRSQRAAFDPRLRGGEQPEQNFTFYHQQQQGYDMNAVPPPPAYNPNFTQPPVYAGAMPGEGTAKNPFQDPPSSAVGGEGSSGIQPPQQVHYPPPPQPSGAPPSYQ